MTTEAPALGPIPSGVELERNGADFTLKLWRPSLLGARTRPVVGGILTVVALGEMAILPFPAKLVALPMLGFVGALFAGVGRNADLIHVRDGKVFITSRGDKETGMEVPLEKLRTVRRVRRSPNNKSQFPITEGCLSFERTGLDFVGIGVPEASLDWVVTSLPTLLRSPG